MEHEIIQTGVQKAISKRLDFVKMIAPEEPSSDLIWMSVDHIVEAFCRHWEKEPSVLISTGLSFFPQDNDQADSSDPYFYNVGLTFLSNPIVCRLLTSPQNNLYLQKVKSLFEGSLWNVSDHTTVYAFNTARSAEGLLQLERSLGESTHPQLFSAEEIFNRRGVVPLLEQMANAPDLLGTLLQERYGKINSDLI